MKKHLVGALKIGLSAAILAYLFYRASQDESFSALRSQQKNWGLLFAGFAAFLLVVCNNITRWYLLVRALNMQFSLRDAFRLGFLSYLFNFFTVGIVGGDLLKAVFLARQQPHRRTEAISTVVADRLIGMYGLFIVASVAYLAVGIDVQNVRDPAVLQWIHRVVQTALVLTIVGSVGLAMMLLPGFTTSPLWDLLVHIPKLGSVFERMIAAMRMYRRRVDVLLLTVVMSVGTHVLSSLSIYAIAVGLPGGEPPLGAHFVIVPITSVAAALPLPGGVGPFEATLDFLYRAVTSAEVAPRQGFVVALAYRVITILVAMIGVLYYLAGRRQVDELIHQAEEVAQAPSLAER